MVQFLIIDFPQVFVVVIITSSVCFVRIICQCIVLYYLLTYIKATVRSMYIVLRLLCNLYTYKVF